jgi:hypothetical protein
MLKAGLASPIPDGHEFGLKSIDRNPPPRRGRALRLHPLSRFKESDIIRRVDVFITRDASLDIKALSVLRPGPPAWGFLVGHKRGHRVFVERLFPACSAALPPPAERLDELDRLLGRRVVGLFAVRPGAGLKKSLLGPYFYGRVFLDVRFPKSGPVVRPFVVEFDRAFFLAPVGLLPGPKGGAS